MIISSRFKSLIKNLIESEWYTNQGPLLNDFEAKLESVSNFENAICCTNFQISLIMTLECLKTANSVYNFFGKVSNILNNSINWCNIDKLFYVDFLSQIKHPDILVIHSNDLVLINIEDLKVFQNIIIIEDCISSNEKKLLSKRIILLKKILTSCNLFYIQNFNKDSNLYALDASCIYSNSRIYSEKLRNIRSSYGVRVLVDVDKTANGRVSEIQALYGLESLSHLE